MQRKQTVLVTGGAGYIGSHVVVELLASGFKVVIVDNLDNGSQVAVDRVRQISECGVDDLVLEVVDICDKEAFDLVFRKQPEPFVACMHLAGLKAVGESVKKPLHYYQNNIGGSIILFHLLQKYDCMNFVFSSSACVYGDPLSVPINESARLMPTNPYGHSKLFVEQMMNDLCESAKVTHPHDLSKQWKMISLRYFNPIGAHESGLIGEDPQGFPNNLLPYVAQVAIGKRSKLSVFGSDYPTKDGTGVRDYIHITDLAKGHVAALTKLLDPNLAKKYAAEVEVYNLGTGTGVSVLEVVHAFGNACGHPIPYEMVARRPGDVASVYADASKAEHELEWTARLGIEQMCADAWNWQKSNPNGFRTEQETAASVNGVGDKDRKAKVFKLLS